MTGLLPQGLTIRLAFAADAVSVLHGHDRTDIFDSFFPGQIQLKSEVYIHLGWSH
jgi:hypothetical protein